MEQSALLPLRNGLCERQLCEQHLRIQPSSKHFSLPRCFAVPLGQGIRRDLEAEQGLLCDQLLGDLSM